MGGGRPCWRGATPGCSCGTPSPRTRSTTPTSGTSSWPAETSIRRRRESGKESMMRLKDKVVIVTGGAKGIGRTYCLGMAAEGARVVVADVADPKSTVQEVEAR